jgi:alkanesulfonate monooxygenase SsuD/methylene tetrahydromethanopterin reductase-like flavin-dependent oxidoreductase (luciferase family)
MRRFTDLPPLPVPESVGHTLRMVALGTVYLPTLPPEGLRDVARVADDAGLEQLWLWEDCFEAGGVSAAAAVLAWTERLHVGVGLLPVPLRNVALSAMEVATLHRLFPGRLHLGIGHGVQSWMRQAGVGVKSPLTLLEEYGTALRALLAGDEVTVAGRYVSLDHVRLHWPPAGRPALLAGAQGPRSLRLCGQIGDGTVIVAGTSPDGVRAARRLVDEGRAAAGRTDPHPLIVYLLAATGPGAEQRVEASRPSWSAPGEDVVAVGDAHAVADAVLRWVDAGADTVVLQPTADDPDPEGFVRFVAREVRPLVG